ncbi:hypothetical protein GGS20DRAFT_529261 [Poronia punctata]|nr:hypothetical protein GGS20DRAFT_529261 [Poronia punctata]
MSGRRRSGSKIPVGGSWRLVEGENESFDTSIIHDDMVEEFMAAGPSQSTASSQGTDSQDSIRDFADGADEDQVILRVPFQPSIASTRHASVTTERASTPEFFMPTVDTAASPRRTSDRSPRTGRRMVDEGAQMRRRNPRREYSGGFRHATPEPQPRAAVRKFAGPQQRPGVSERAAASVPEFLYDCLAWVLSVLGMALRLAKWPVAMFVAVYLATGVATMGKNMITQSVTASLQPVCRMPGASLLNLPFCPESQGGDSHRGGHSVEFDELMQVQAQFEKVLQDSADGVTLPMGMLRSEASVRDLRTVVKHSELPARNELVLEFDGYINSIHQTTSDLQVFNTHVGSAVDSVININRWTSRYIDSVAEKREERNNFLSRTVDWLLSPFQPVVFEERFLLDKYIEHTAYVSDKIADLILEAQAILRLLSQAEDHMQHINEHVVRSSNTVKEKHNQVFYTLWTLLGLNNRHLHNLNQQLSLLNQIEVQRQSAIRQLLGLIHDLGDIQSKLGDLRDRVAAPELLANTSSIPLHVHIETINAGIERLEQARRRIGAEEDERLQLALRGSNVEDRMIEG